ncbi:MAG: Maf family protein [Phycisphaerales bacterium]
MPQSGLTNADPLIWLASRSPRRRQLLTEAGIRHIAEHPGIEDSELETTGRRPEQWVASLAYLKAMAGAAAARIRLWEESVLVLGSDTACVQDGRMIGTPCSAEEAGAMLRSFRSATHRVVTGVALVGLDRDEFGVPRLRTLCTCEADVRWGDVGEDEIERYLASNAWQGKAGAYNLRERVEAGWPIEIRGGEDTVMGLPIEAVRKKVRALSERAGWRAGERRAAGVPG